MTHPDCEALAKECELYAKVIEGIIVAPNDWKEGDSTEHREPRGVLLRCAAALRDSLSRPSHALDEPVAWITKAGLENFLKGAMPEQHVLLRSGNDMRVALYAGTDVKKPPPVDWEFDLKETLKAVLFHFGTDGAALVTGHVMEARKAASTPRETVAGETVQESQAKASETSGDETAGHGMKPDAGRLAVGRTTASNVGKLDVTAGETASSDPMEGWKQHPKYIETQERIRDQRRTAIKQVASCGDPMVDAIRELRRRDPATYNIDDELLKLIALSAVPVPDRTNDHLTLQKIAEAVHRGRFKDRTPTPFEDEDRQGREYCFGIAREVTALVQSPVPTEQEGKS